MHGFAVYIVVAFVVGDPESKVVFRVVYTFDVVGAVDEVSRTRRSTPFQSPEASFSFC